MLRKNFPGRKHARRVKASARLVRHYESIRLRVMGDPDDHYCVHALRRIERELATLHERTERA